MTTTSGGNKGIGRLTSWSDESGSGSRVYNNFGNITSETRVIGGKTYTMSYSYDLANRLTEIIYPSGRYVDYTYDSSRLPDDRDDQAQQRRQCHHPCVHHHAQTVRADCRLYLWEQRGSDENIR